MSHQGWIGVDLDGTLAHYDGWVGVEHIGPPVPAMLARVKAWLGEGREVRIFTARVWPITSLILPGQPIPVVDGSPRAAQAYAAACAIGDYCMTYLGCHLPITCVKDFGMIELWDDRCIQVRLNTGKRADGEA